MIVVGCSLLSVCCCVLRVDCLCAWGCLLCDVNCLFGLLVVVRCFVFVDVYC